YFGVVGLAAVLIIGDLIKNLIIFFLLKRKFPLEYNFKGYIRYFLFYSTMFIVSILMGYVHIHNLFVLLPVILLYGLFLLVVLYWSSFLDEAESAYIRNMLNSSNALRKIKDKFYFVFKILRLQS